MNLQTVISAKVKTLYDFHEYEMSKDNLIKVTNSFFEIKPDLDIEYFDNFIKEVRLGKYGVLYRMPTCILSMFQKFINEPKNIVPHFSSGSRR